MAKWIKTSGEIIEVSPKDGKTFSLDELHDFVDGYIEMVQIPHSDFLMLVNEEGLIMGLPKNQEVKNLYDLDIVGNVLITTLEEID